MIRLPLLLFVFAVSSCSGGEIRSPGSQGNDGPDYDPGPAAKTLVYECTGLEFIARSGPGEMAVWIGDHYRVLPRVRSASGEKYREGDILVWVKGNELLVEVDSWRYDDCRLNPARVPWEDARRRGIDFRASGNEPAWHLELRERDHLLFVGDYGAVRVMLGDPARTEAGAQVRYHASGPADALTILISDVPCTDTMAGSQYPSTVQVEHNGRYYQGCGMSLEHPWE